MGIVTASRYDRARSISIFLAAQRKLAPIAGEAIHQAVHANLSHHRKVQGQNPTLQHFDTLLPGSDNVSPAFRS
jgi:hypothetical protein